MVPPSLLRFFLVFLFISILLLDLSICSPVSIFLNPSILSKPGDSVRIQWTGVGSPSSLDWLGIYSPPDSPDDNFIGYVFLSSCNNWQSGSCFVDLPLVNLRSNYQFRIFRWTEDEVDRSRLDHDHNPLPGTKHLLAKSEELGFETGRGPEQIHLSFTTKVDEMRVMFVTADGKESFVKYGEREHRLDNVAVTEVRTYERLDMCDSPANESIGWRDPGFIHDGVMTNLKSGIRYYYKLCSIQLLRFLLYISIYDMGSIVRTSKGSICYIADLFCAGSHHVLPQFEGIFRICIYYSLGDVSY